MSRVHGPPAPAERWQSGPRRMGALAPASVTERRAAAANGVIAAEAAI
jgi:hypothetical protein